MAGATEQEFSRVNVMRLLNQASFDARNNGWVVHAEDDESITLAANDFEYTIPEDYCYISSLWLGDTQNGVVIYDQLIPAELWEPRLNGALPIIYFISPSFIVAGRTIKIVGQKRPKQYADEQQTIDTGMESFLRERTLYFLFRVLGAGLSDLARWRQTMSQQSWASSERFLLNNPQLFRQAPNSRYVPGR